ncbi:dTMP kinase [Brasilonema sp. UFV-L1]|uniref:dTMP kinase n=1 Tax=Brasilonema sp. UFV-L1 TaxID=2234130 RepID=UPI00145EB66D|nr:dTMP kinase [Brasilonema sp. UFV-L1]NMG11847.1 dTMP kinase [Brasilonema sp. UFV-L1]
MKGKLVVFEGVEGCGKTSQIQLTQEWLQSLKTSVVVTRQPGGTELGLYVRKLLLEVGSHSIANTTELLLYAADRSQHVEEVIKPSLSEGAIVLCDRYTHSTIAYQGWGRGLDMNLIHQLNTIATSGLESDLTLWFDVDIEVGLARKQRGGNMLDRIEKETIAFHRRVQQGYTHLADSYPEQIVRVDASLSQEAVQQKIRATLTAKLKAWVD